jgi:hypothetical protein
LALGVTWNGVSARDKGQAMGGFGSGWHGGKDLTSDYRALDVRQLGRHGRLTPAQTFGWSWTRDGEIVASIQGGRKPTEWS